MSESNGVSERAADQAYRLLRRDIANGTLLAGQRLGEIELADRYGFSRTPIRETLRRLEAEGMVEVLPHRGARVADWSDIDVEAAYDLRAMVEAYAASRAATRITDDELAELSALCDEMEAITAIPAALEDLERVDRVAQLNEQLHATVARIADFPLLLSMRGMVFVVPLVQRMVHLSTAEDVARSNAQHRDLIAALGAHDPAWADAVMRSHVLTAKFRLLRQGS